MRVVLYIVALALLAGGLYWVATSHRSAEKQISGGVVGSGMGPTTSGQDPATTMNNVHGAANRIEDDSFKRNADIDKNTAP